MDSIGWYIQMEFIDGITLDQFLETNPPAAIRHRILEQLIDALSCLHERQIIHRDIKPSNILITRNGNTVKLIDFGVSDTDDYVTFKQPAGSMAYIAPEQLAGKTIDNRADIYAVGKIINLLFPDRYKYIVRICTRVKPAERYSSCAQVLQAIRRADRVRIWLPVSLILLLLSCAAVWGTYSGYQHSELAHKENEKQLFVHVDSLRAQNEEHRHQVDSLNRVLDSLAVKANMPSQEEILNLKIKQIYQDYISRVEDVIRTQDIIAAVDTHPTPAEQWYQEMTELFVSVGDDEELRLYIQQANGRYYAAIYLPFMDHMADPLSKLVRSEADYKAFRLEQYF
jgi:serine/threonine protein kinase